MLGRIGKRALLGSAVVAGGLTSATFEDGSPSQATAQFLSGDPNTFRYLAKAQISNSLTNDPRRDNDGYYGSYYGRNYRAGANGSSQLLTRSNNYQFRPDGSSVFGAYNLRRGW